jgi:ankyrin repeat protein
LHYAALFSTVAIVKYLIELGVNPYSKNNYTLTPLHIAVEHPDSEMLETLIEYGLTSYDMSKFSQSPYDIALQKNKYEAVELFNRLKNDKTYQSKLKRNPLTLSIVMNEFDKADSLIDIVNVNDKDIFGNTPLYYAIMNKEYFLVERLLKKDASIYSIDFTGDDAIYYATLVGDVEIVKLIQTRKIDYEKKYGEYTVLEYAKHNRLKIILEQLKKGMN